MMTHGSDRKSNLERDGAETARRKESEPEVLPELRLQGMREQLNLMQEQELKLCSSR
jgi:hypothetical protein